MYVSSFKLAVFGGSGEKMTLNLRGDGISSQGVRKFVAVAEDICIAWRWSEQ